MTPPVNDKSLEMAENGRSGSTSSVLFNPACACDMELEIKVPDKPVKIKGTADEEEDRQSKSRV